MKTIKNTAISLVLIILTALALSACRTAATEPVEKEDTTPGRRDYTWTVDTVVTPFTELARFWGASANNLWVAGDGTFTENNLWHFDGSKWAKGNLKSYGTINPNAIYGFAQDNVWLAGYEGKIWNGDGAIWKQSLQYSSLGYRLVTFLSVWGNSSNNIYAVGSYDSLVNNKDNFHGLIFHYDGQNWQRVNLAQNNYQFMKIYQESKGNGKYYIWGTSGNYVTGEDTLKFLEFDGSKTREIFAQLNTNITSCSMALINGKIYFVKNSDVCRYANGAFTVIKTIAGIEQGFILGGRNENDLFFGMPDGIAHYNGTDLQYVYKKPVSTYIFDIALFENEVFFLVDQMQEKSFIVKGILK
jgi:hypothetical protein